MTRRFGWKAFLSLLLGATLAISGGVSAQALTIKSFFLDTFSSTALSNSWTVLGEDRSAWSLTQKPGALTLTTKDAALYEGDNRPVNVFLRNAPMKDYDFTTRLHFDPEFDYEQAGILLWAGPDDFAQLTFSHQGGLAFLGGIETGGTSSLELLENVVGNDILLRLSKYRDVISFAYSVDGLRWTDVGQPVKSSTAYPSVGLFSSSTGSKRAIGAQFDYVAATPYLRLPEKKKPTLPADSAPLTPTAEQVSVPYTNPVQDWTSGDPATADPSVARGPDGTYYMVGSESEYTYSSYHALPIFSSPDLVHWTYLTDVFPTRDDYPDWVEDTQTDRIDFWAPDISFQDGKMYVYYGATQKSDSADPANDKAIGVAVADSPTGPFADKGTPIITGTSFRAIDQQVFTDTDGKRYMYWGSAFYPILAQRLADDGMSVVGPIKQVLPSHQGSGYIFDTDNPGGGNYENLIEGAWVMKKGNWYYLFYSGPNCCGPGANYSVGIARATTPLGPFTKLPANPILTGNESVVAPGHNAIAQDDAGQEWIVYHSMDGETNSIGDASRRNLAIDRVEWKDGWPVIDGPSSTAVADGPIIDASRVGTDGPRPVSDLRTIGVTDETVSIAWSPSNDSVTGYLVYQDGVQVADVQGSATDYTFTGLDVCTLHAYSVRPLGTAGTVGDAGGRLEVTSSGCPEGTATDHTIDRTTQGNWVGVFGSGGYQLAGSASAATPGVELALPAGHYVWAGSTTEERALQLPDQSNRIASTWFGGTLSIGVSSQDAAAHRVTLYLLDWDTTDQRRQSITVTNQQGVVLDTVTAADLGAFSDGAAVSWIVTGNVTITSQVEAGANAVVSGVFIDAAP